MLKDSTLICHPTLFRGMFYAVAVVPHKGYLPLINTEPQENFEDFKNTARQLEFCVNLDDATWLARFEISRIIATPIQDAGMET